MAAQPGAAQGSFRVASSPPPLSTEASDRAAGAGAVHGRPGGDTDGLHGIGEARPGGDDGAELSR